MKRLRSIVMRGSCSLLMVAWLAPYAGAQSGGPWPEYGWYGDQIQHGKSLEVGDPISAGSGAFFWSKQLFQLGGPMNLGFSIHYRTDPNAYWPPHPRAFPVGDGHGGMYLHAWRWQPAPILLGNFLYRITVQLEDGGQVCFRQVGDNFVRYNDSGTLGEVDRDFQLKKVEEWLYFFDPHRERVTMFEKLPGEGYLYRPVTVIDRNENQLTYAYASEHHNNPASISDTVGRVLNFVYEWGVDWRLASVTDQAEREWRFLYAHGANAEDNGGRLTLRGMVSPEQHTHTFLYRPNTFSYPPDNISDQIPLLVSVVEPLSNAIFSNEYDVVELWDKTQPHVRVIRQDDAYGNTLELDYTAEANRVTETRVDGEVVVYEHYHNRGLPKTVTDASGNSYHVGQTAREQISSVTDRLGETTTVTYHPETGRIASYQNAEGQTVSYTYLPQDQTFINPTNDDEVAFTFHTLARVDYPDGTFEAFTHDARGNVLTRTDQAGKVWAYTYNERGQVLTVENPGGGVATYTYNADATLATRTDSDTGVTTFGYDIYKRVNRVDYPDGSFSLLDYDLQDRVTLLTNENGHETAFTYDANGNLVKITDSDGEEMLLAYDLMDRLVSMTDRLGNASTRAYDVMGRLSEFADATGVTTAIGYDPRGWANTRTRAGKTWTTTYDDEGVPTAMTTPLGRAVQRLTDKLGHAVKLTDGTGGETELARDAMSRVTAVTDPNGLVTGYDYDALGRLAGITLPDSESVVYAYNDLGALESVTDFNGSEWTFAYTLMGRLTRITDPLERETGYGYDSRGRLSGIAFPDGDTLTITRDGVGNVTRRLYSGGLDLHYTFDTQNRLLAADGLGLARDAEGRITGTENTGTVFGATYDGAGRLASVAYPSTGSGQAFTVTYTYDVGAEGSGRLIGVSDDLTGTSIAFDYDGDERLHTVTLPNGETIAYTWDDVDRLVRLQSGHHVDLQLTLDPGGRIAVQTLTAPLVPAPHLLLPSTHNLPIDAASQLTGPDFTYDPRGRLTQSTINHQSSTFSWDDASRLTGINGAVLTYNGLGQVRERTQYDATLRYYYNHAIGGAPIVAERDTDSGDFLRYYIWTPGGRLLYMIDATDDNKVYFYHFNQVGSTLALTDADGAVTDAWAYDPYGNVLERTGTNPQPFTFVGAHGVRQEGDDGLYQMRARYYEANTGRFLSPEPIWPQLSEPKALNPYQYAAGDPLRFIDPTGLSIFNHITIYDPAFSGWDEEKPAPAPAEQAQVSATEPNNVGLGLERFARVGNPLFPMEPEKRRGIIEWERAREDRILAQQDDFLLMKWNEILRMGRELERHKAKLDRLMGNREMCGKLWKEKLEELVPAILGAEIVLQNQLESLKRLINVRDNLIKR